MEPQNTPWEAIAARLKNEASDEQLLQIEEWLALSPENHVVLSEIVSTWSITKYKTEFYEPDKSINWEKLMKRIGHSQSRTIQLNTWYRWIAAASIISVVFLAGLGLGDRFFKPSPTISFVKITAPEGSKTQIVLPDSTHVWLNSGAELQYPNDFTAQNRQVTMQGECFFDVTKDPEHPFIIDGTKLRVKVYGTRFNVNEDRFTSGTYVTLISGNVEVYNMNNQLLSKLIPGEQLVYNNGVSHLQKTKNPEALTSWINNMLIFNNQPFEEVIHYLEKWYGVNITLDKTLYYNYNYSFKVKTESLREVLDLISFITPIEYRIEGEKVTIKYRQHMKK
ncbi:MAG TPA: FecR family protein [Prolixibacteraceae bacterium]|nr:FecR family protein [Prolixibacteraceae bacterium]